MKFQLENGKKSSFKNWKKIQLENGRKMHLKIGNRIQLPKNNFKMEIIPNMK